MATGPALVRAGFAVTVVGLGLALIALLPLVTSVELPSLFWALAMLVGIGVGLILTGLFAQGHRRSRIQRSVTVGTVRPTD